MGRWYDITLGGSIGLLGSATARRYYPERLPASSSLRRTVTLLWCSGSPWPWAGRLGCSRFLVGREYSTELERL